MAQEFERRITHFNNRYKRWVFDLPFIAFHIYPMHKLEGIPLAYANENSPNLQYVLTGTIFSTRRRSI
jgi:hypothetical protein